MNIYFTAAIIQHESLGKNYEEIVHILEEMGHKVVHEHITKKKLADVQATSEEQNVDYYRKIVKQIAQCDLVVAELSFPSTLNVGHEISLALEKGKPVIGLYVKDRLSFFFQGIKSDKFIYEEYSPGTLKTTLKDSIDFARDISDTRFNFFLPPNLMYYLDWVADKKKIPRSAYLRDLIEKDKEKNKEYSG